MSKVALLEQDMRDTTRQSPVANTETLGHLDRNGIFVKNGIGPVAQRLAQAKYDVPKLRPYILDPKYTGGVFNPDEQFVGNADGSVQKLVNNANYTMTYDQWKYIDQTIGKVFRKRRGAWKDLEANDMVFDLPGGIGKTLMLTQQASDPGKANVGMDPGQRSDRDRPVRNETLMPIPIIWADWSFEWRELEVAATSGMQLDTWEVEAATERVWEVVEQLVLGNWSGGVYTYGSASLYGYTNWPSRLTGSMTVVNGSWTGKNFLQDILAMRQALYNIQRYGPYILYVGMGWDQYLDLDYSDSKVSGTIRQRVLAIGGGVNANTERSGTGYIVDIKTLDWLPSMAVVMVEVQKRSVRGIRAMDLRALRWETSSGLHVNGKVMCSLLPNLLASFTGQVGIAHYS